MQTSMLPLRSVVMLCAFSLTMAALCALILLRSGTYVNAALLPQFLAGGALLFVTLGAPFVFKIDAPNREHWLTFAARAALAAVWCGVISGFMLLVAARISPLEIDGLVHASICIALMAWVSIVIHAAVPRAASGILIAWIVLPPVGAYMLAEVFLTSPAGGAGLLQSTAPQAAKLRDTIHWALNLSPGTATFGALTGVLADGSNYCRISGYCSMICAGVVALVIMSFHRTEFQLRSDEPSF